MSRVCHTERRCPAPVLAKSSGVSGHLLCCHIFAHSFVAPACIVFMRSIRDDEDERKETEAFLGPHHASRSPNSIFQPQAPACSLPCFHFKLARTTPALTTNQHSLVIIHHPSSKLMLENKPYQAPLDLSPPRFSTLACVMPAAHV